MSALSEALVAAQRAALTAAAKAHVQYQDGTPDKGMFHSMLNKIGCTDQVEQEQLWEAWNVLRSAGAPVPQGKPETAQPDNGTAPASDAQLALIAKLVKEKNVTGPGLPITKQQAHEVIDAIEAGTYDPAAYTVPF